MKKSNTALTVANNRRFAQSSKKKFAKRGLLSKITFLVTNTSTWLLDGSHSLLNVMNSGIINSEIKLSDNEHMRAYVSTKNKELGKKNFLGLIWSIISFPFTTNKRSKHLGAYVNEKTEEMFFSDVIEQWQVVATKEEKKDMKIILKLLKGLGIKRKAVIKLIEDDFGSDVHMFFVDALTKYSVEIDAARK